MATAKGSSSDGWSSKNVHDIVHRAPSRLANIRVTVRAYWGHPTPSLQYEWILTPGIQYGAIFRGEFWFLEGSAEIISNIADIIWFPSSPVSKRRDHCGFFKLPGPYSSPFLISQPYPAANVNEWIKSKQSSTLVSTSTLQTSCRVPWRSSIHLDFLFALSATPF